MVGVDGALVNFVVRPALSMALVEALVAAYAPSGSFHEAWDEKLA